MKSKNGFRWEKRACVDCGEKFIAKTPRSIRCLDCREKHTAEVRRRNSRERYAKERISTSMTMITKKKPAEPKKDPNVCRRTKSCVYGGKMGGINICDYLEIMGERRPCPVKDCSVYKRRQGGRRKENQDKWGNGTEI